MTEQSPDLLIYNSEIINIYNYPLENLAEIDKTINKKLIDTTCLSSDCWRQHIATWIIENDSLFLSELKDCCEYKDISLDKIFDKKDIQEDRVFAYWYTDKINAGFGKNIGFSETEWRDKYENEISVNIKSGIIQKILITKND
ncbi:hypothetical protein SAMN05444411_1213 [Lutibacter oricola]|uniref:Uncharacterized protein n=1 Tax=Lutibacter oricola TaxID=762486 RepID=A0A1H3GZP1_9FLAO|nr:hypothetical protein [Lutibacter oricola]SDY08405.1 hypothetical protein SAMN05444411_1213 [Lutibacter oricola]